MKIRFLTKCTWPKLLKENRQLIVDIPMGRCLQEKMCRERKMFRKGSGKEHHTLEGRYSFMVFIYMHFRRGIPYNYGIQSSLEDYSLYCPSFSWLACFQVL